MVISFKINIPFWIDIEENDVEKSWKDSTRLRNTLFVEKEVSKMVDNFKSRGLDIRYEIYDFSPYKVIDGATHIPYPFGFFKKSEKWNQIIERTHETVFIGLDSDCFVHETEFDILYNFLSSPTAESDVCIFNTRGIKPANVNDIDFENHNIDNILTMDVHHYYTYGYVGSFGGLWVCPTRYLKEIGGFNENLKYYGHEDGEVLTRIYHKAHGPDNRFQIHKVLDLLPYHLPHYQSSDSRYRNQDANLLTGEWVPRTDW